MCSSDLSQTPQSRSRSRSRHSRHRYSERRSRHHSDKSKSSSSSSGKSHRHKKKHRSCSESWSPSRHRASRHRSPVSDSEDMTFPGVDASPGTQRRYLDRVHSVFKRNAPPGTEIPAGDEQQGPLVDVTSKVPPSIPTKTLRSLVGSVPTPTART